MLLCRTLSPGHFMSSMCPLVCMEANGFHIVSISPGNRLHSALRSDIALVSAVCPFRLPEQAALVICSLHCIFNDDNVRGFQCDLSSSSYCIDLDHAALVQYSVFVPK